MKISDWKEKTGHTFDQISAGTGIPVSTLHRISQDNQCKKLVQAYKIVRFTAGQVGMEDLMPDGEMI